MRKSKDKDVNIIGGYSAAEAIKRARSRMRSHTNPKPEKRETSEPEPKHKKIRPDERRTRFGRTALPSRNQIVCYECGYAFTLPGSIHETYCPKCRKFLDRSDYTITRETTESTRTVGSVSIEENAVLKDVSVIARNITVSGDAARATLRASDTLQINKNARFDITRLRMSNLVIGTGADITIERNVSCQNLEIRGCLRSNIMCDGTAKMSAGAVFVGRLYSRGLVIEDGTRLQAELHATPSL